MTNYRISELLLDYVRLAKFTQSLLVIRNFVTHLIFAAMKSFDVPIIYRSPLISAIKKKRKEMDKMKKDFTPTLLDFGPLHIYLARILVFVMVWKMPLRSLSEPWKKTRAKEFSY